MSTTAPVALDVRDLRTPDEPGRPLGGVTFQVPRGRCVALLGPQGSGASTTLAAIAGRVPGASGTVRVLGRDPLAVDRREAEAAGLLVSLAAIPAEPDAEAVPDVRSLLASAVNRHDGPAPQTEARVEAALDRFVLRDWATYRPHMLSRGTLARTMLACALVQPVPVVLVDDPTSGLDRASVDLAAEALADSIRGGTAVLLATHDHAFAERVAGSAVLLEEGASTAAGSVADMAARAEAAELAGW